MIQIFPITQPGVDLKAFIKILGQHPVNQVDGKPIKLVAKFGLLTEKLLNQDWSDNHLYQTFYMTLPTQVEMAMRNFADYDKIKINCIEENFGFVAFMSASFTVWKNFIKYLVADELLIDVGHALRKYFDQFEYVKPLKELT